jgi:hypothetical protein
LWSYFKTSHFKISFDSGEFANHLPDYQKIQILMFVMGKVPKVTDTDSKWECSSFLL